MSATGKFAIFLVVAVIVPPVAVRAQAPCAQGGPASASCADVESCGPCPDSSCDNATCGENCCRPFAALLSRLQAECQPVPWANWSEHPLSLGCFVGAVNGGPLIEDWVGTTTGFLGGWRLGWDADPHFGLETRMAFGDPALYDSYRANQAMIARENANGQTYTPAARRLGSLFQWDVDVLCYPWGETRLRPYFLTGMGLTNIAFSDRLGENYQITCLSLPLGVGLKYLCSERVAVRLDLLDDIALSTDHLQTQQNVSLNAGVELRFGGSRKLYWPWDLSRSLW